jgi:L-iditol 2-dehydrogenase
MKATYIFRPVTITANQVIIKTHNRGADLAFEAVGSSATVNLGISLLRKGGRIVLVGNIAPQVDIPLQKVVTGELQLLGSCAIRGEYASVLDLLEHGKISITPFISAVAFWRPPHGSTGSGTMRKVCIK